MQKPRFKRLSDSLDLNGWGGRNPPSTELEPAFGGDTLSAPAVNAVFAVLLPALFEGC
jgi:hypothetical protein